MISPVIGINVKFGLNGKCVPISLCIFRGFVIAVFSPILRRTGYGLTWKEGIIMTWGGLRGAVGLALALQVAHHDTIDQEKIGVRVCGTVQSSVDP